MLHVKALFAVLLLLIVLSFPLYKYWSYLSKGMSPSSSTQILDEIEKNGPPAFRLQDLNGKSYRLADFSNSIVIINFWASWCAPCVKEFPSLRHLVEKMDHKVTVLAISADSDRADLESFLKSFGNLPPEFIVLWDKQKQVSDSFGTQVFPESYIFGRDGKFVRKVAGIDEWDSPLALQFFRDLVNK
jgi:thiol-disulfide isomerase/thioredoxin